MNDILRAALISMFSKLFPMLVVIGAVNLTDVQTAIIMAFISDAITVIFLVVKYGQQASGTSSTVTASVTTSPE